MRLVDAEAKSLLMELSTYSRYTGIDEAPIETAVDAIHQAPTIDAVPVVRCKDCKWSNVYQVDSDFPMERWCNGSFIPKTVQDYDYCSWGERKDDE